MRPISFAAAGLAAAFVIVVNPKVVNAQETAARPEVGHALEAAETAIRQKQFDVARDELAKAAAAPSPSAYERVAIEQTRGVLAQASGDVDGALEAFRHLLATERMATPDRARMEHSVAALSFSKQDYPATADYAGKAIHDGDTDPALPLLVAESAYAAGDYKQAYAVLSGQIQAAARAKKKPALIQLQMLASSAQKLGDDAGYGAALEAMATNYPDTATTAALFARIQAKPGVGTRYALDLIRLKRQLGMLTTAADYEDAAQQVLSSGFPGEANQLIAEAYDRHIFGQSADSTRQDRLKAYAAKQLAQDKQGLEHATADANDSRDGGGLVRVGYDMVTQGDPAGLALIEQGVKKGGMARPDQASLTLGEAYVLLGRKSDAAGIFRTIKGADGAADLAHLWTIALQQGS